jgi:hypothetical protein
MEINEKNKYKIDFKSKLDAFAKELKNYVSTKDGDWTVKGFIDVYKNIYTISSDTKIVSKILEIHIFPKILEFAEKNKYKLILAEQQNWYPDITFTLRDNEEVKFAVDIKTTFRRNNNTAGFTLGSHGSYFKERNKAKNIQFPYSKYIGHYCLGIIYTRVDFTDDLEDTKVFQVKELNEEYAKDVKKIGPREVTNVDSLISITSVIKDFDFFAAEKWKIASDKQGSGNTANIGSVNNIDDLKNETGIFSKLGEEWFDEYWINYGSATYIKGGQTEKIKSLEDFLIFKGKKELLSKIMNKKTK